MKEVIFNMKDSEYLIASIDLETGIRNGDLKAAKAVCKQLNEGSLTVEQKNGISDLLETSAFQPEDGVEVLEYVLANLNCLTNAPLLCKALEISKLIQNRDIPSASQWLDANINPDMFTGIAFYANYAKSVLLLCRLAGRYDKMEEVRGILKEMG